MIMIGCKYKVLFNRGIFTDYTDIVEVVERVVKVVGETRSEFVILKNIISRMISLSWF